MEKINEYETEKERKRRDIHSRVRREYLERSTVILSGEVRPHRVIAKLADKYGYSIMGIKWILRQAGIYKDAKHPVILSGAGTPTQATLSFQG